jgi:hypothetical protein
MAEGWVPARITLTRSVGFDEKTAQQLQALAATSGEDPRAVAARLLRESLARLCEVGDGD